MFEAVKNAEGQNVYPSKAVGFIDEHNAIFSDEEFEKIKNPPSPMNNQGSQPDGAQPSNDAGQQANPASDSVEPAVGGSTSDQGEPAASAPAPAVDYNGWLREKTAGKFESIEQVLEQINKPAAPTFENEQSRQLYEMLQQNKTDEVLDFLQMQAILGRTDKMSPAEKIKLQMLLDNPEWSEQDAEDEFNDRYMVDIDESTMPADKAERLKRAAERKILADSKAASQYLEQKRTELKLPAIGGQPADDPEVTAYKKDIETMNEVNKQFTEALENIASQPGTGTIDLSVTDKDVQFTHSFEITPEEMTQLVQQAKDYWETFKSSYSKDGQWQAKQILQDLYIRNHLPQIIKSAITKAMNDKHIDIVKGMANADTGKPPVNNLDAAEAANREEKARFIML